MSKPNEKIEKIEIPFPNQLPWGEWESKEMESDYWEEITGDR